MANKNYMYAVDRSDEYLAHYGIKGMKWGVRKAIESGNNKALARQYKKASRKLEKLQARAENGKKYARRAALMGAGAVAAGGLAAAGTRGVGNALREGGRLASGAARSVSGGLHGAGMAMMKSRNSKVQGLGAALYRGGTDLEAAAKPIRSKGVHVGNAVSRWGKGRHDIATAAQNIAGKYGHPGVGEKISSELTKRGAGSVSNNTLARIGAGAVGAGLAAGAGYNAYRAATTKRAAKKAAEFQREMNQAFKGTQYANGGNGSKPSGNRKRRRR